jgi:hypothetical protein
MKNAIRHPNGPTLSHPAGYFLVRLFRHRTSDAEIIDVNLAEEWRFIAAKPAGFGNAGYTRGQLELRKMGSQAAAEWRVTSSSHFHCYWFSSQWAAIFGEGRFTECDQLC